MNADTLKPTVEAILMAADAPVSVERLAKLLDDEDPKPAKDDLREVLDALASDYDGRGVELVEVASGFRFQARADYGERVSRLWEERRPRYSRALLETLAIIAYRQPITRGEIEHIRGVAVSTGIVRTLLEREWVRVVGHRDVPGRPAVYATTKEFLDYFGMKSLEELPSLAELKDVDDINPDMFAELEATAAAEATDDAASDAETGDVEDAAADGPANEAREDAADETADERAEATGDALNAAPGHAEEPAAEDDEPEPAQGRSTDDPLDEGGTGLAAAPPDTPR